MSVYLDIKSLYPHLKVNWNVLLCKICIARRLVVDIFPWCNAHYVPFPSGTLVARRMGNGSIKSNSSYLEDCDTTLLFFFRAGGSNWAIHVLPTIKITMICQVCVCNLYLLRSVPEKPNYTKTIAQRSWVHFVSVCFCMCGRKEP